MTISSVLWIIKRERWKRERKGGKEMQKETDIHTQEDRKAERDKNREKEIRTRDSLKKKIPPFHI